MRLLNDMVNIRIFKTCFVSYGNAQFLYLGCRLLHKSAGFRICYCGLAEISDTSKVWFVPALYTWNSRMLRLDYERIALKTKASADRGWASGILECISWISMCAPPSCFVQASSSNMRSLWLLSSFFSDCWEEIHGEYSPLFCVFGPLSFQRNTHFLLLPATTKQFAVHRIATLRSK